MDADAYRKPECDILAVYPNPAGYYSITYTITYSDRDGNIRRDYYNDAIPYAAGDGSASHGHPSGGDGQDLLHGS